MTLETSPLSPIAFKARIVLGPTPKKSFFTRCLEEKSSVPDNFVKNLVSDFPNKKSRIEKLKSKLKMTIQIKFPS